MVSYKIEDIKAFTNSLFVGGLFDAFLVREATFCTFCKFTIDGKIKEGYYSKEEAQEAGLCEYAPWGKLKPVCFSLIKGKRLPLSFSVQLKLGASEARRLVQGDADGAAGGPDAGGEEMPKVHGVPGEPGAGGAGGELPGAPGEPGAGGASGLGRPSVGAGQAAGNGFGFAPGGKAPGMDLAGAGQIPGFHLHVRYENSELTVVSGVSLNTFSMDKSMEEAWDRHVAAFLRDHGIPAQAG
ncbi:MAG: DUF5721 family protein [Lachnospiraceae bacterium]|nr:DUF5721 family protein [Lachnospiraceae bacterium]